MTKTAEIVTFRLAHGTDIDAFARAAAAMGPFLAPTGGFVARTLSVDADGLWTDHIVWQTLDDAQRAAKAIGSAPEAAAFVASIDGSSVALRHAAVQLE